MIQLSRSDQSTYLQVKDFHIELMSWVWTYWLWRFDACALKGVWTFWKKFFWSQSFHDIRNISKSTSESVSIDFVIIPFHSSFLYYSLSLSLYLFLYILTVLYLSLSIYLPLSLSLSRSLSLEATKCAIIASHLLTLPISLSKTTKRHNDETTLVFDDTTLENVHLKNVYLKIFTSFLLSCLLFVVANVRWRR